jgi:hypothetical protein
MAGFAFIAVAFCAFVAWSDGGLCFLFLFPRLSASRQGGGRRVFPGASREFYVYVHVTVGAGIAARVGSVRRISTLWSAIVAGRHAGRAGSVGHLRAADASGAAAAPIAGVLTDFLVSDTFASGWRRFAGL